VSGCKQEVPRFRELLGQSIEQPSVAALVTLLTVLGCTAEEYGRHLGPWGCVP
jgi:hypothetical protein